MYIIHCKPFYFCYFFNFTMGAGSEAGGGGFIPYHPVYITYHGIIISWWVPDMYGIVDTGTYERTCSFCPPPPRHSPTHCQYHDCGILSSLATIYHNLTCLLSGRQSLCFFFVVFRETCDKVLQPLKLNS